MFGELSKDGCAVLLGGNHGHYGAVYAEDNNLVPPGFFNDRFEAVIYAPMPQKIVSRSVTRLEFYLFVVGL